MRFLIFQFEQKSDLKSPVLSGGNEIRFLEQSDSASYGHELRVQYGNAVYYFTPDLRIVGVRYPDREPWHSTKGTKAGSPPKRGKEITKEDAVEAARRFVEAHWGPDVLEGLLLHVGLNEGAHYYYLTWSREGPGVEIVHGFKRFIVDVSAETGAVFCVLYSEAPPVENPTIGAQAMREIIRKEFAGLQGLRVDYMELYWLYHEGVRRPAWTAWVQFQLPAGLFGGGFAMLRVDANTGEVLIKQ